MKTSSRTINFTTHANTVLSGRIYYPTDSKSLSKILIVPGFTKLGMKRYTQLQKFLAHNSISSMVYDYQGTGKSGGKIENTTISDLLKNTQAALETFQKEIEDGKLILLGYSLGGYLVPLLLNKFKPISEIILISPPPYSSTVNELPLNNSATSFIRSESWSTHSSIYRILAHYSQRILMIFGDSDKEIPLEFRLAFKKLNNKHLVFSTIPNGKHSLLRNRSKQERNSVRLVFLEILKFTS